MLAPTGDHRGARRSVGLAGATVVLPHVRICFNRRRDRQNHPGICPSCDECKPLGYHKDDGSNVCAACAGHASVFACTGCGREDHPYEFSRCVLRERTTVLLTDPATDSTHKQLRPVFEVITGGSPPQTALYWLSIVSASAGACSAGWHVARSRSATKRSMPCRWTAPTTMCVTCQSLLMSWNPTSPPLSR